MIKTDKLPVLQNNNLWIRPGDMFNRKPITWSQYRKSDRKARIASQIRFGMLDRSNILLLRRQKGAE
ncbi:hypothetical protein ACFL2C_00490 [Patescibacteria group bacterium]